jgi:hypothetical protein
VDNNGTTITSGGFDTDLYLDGTKIKSWHVDSPHDLTSYSSFKDYSIGKLSAGTHTLRIVTDSTHAINESNESDNEYTKTISVIYSPPPPASLPHAGTWIGSILSFNVASDGANLTSTGSSLLVAGSPRSFTLYIGGNNCAKVTLFSSSAIPIINNSFNRAYTYGDGSSYTFSGNFSSSTTASGSYSYSGIDDECSGSGTWTTNY